MNRVVIYAVVYLCLMPACSEQSGFVGGGETREEVKKPIQPSPSSAESVPVTPPTQPQIAPPPVIPFIPSMPPIPTVPLTPPDTIVDGQEVYNSCSSCEQRAMTLAQQNGFSVAKGDAVNMGFYKIEPSKNLCDIHFLDHPGVAIDEHNGVDTIGNNQIILYCPCNCGWREPGFLGGPGIF